MGILDSLGNLKNIADQAIDTIVPPSIQNLKTDADGIDKKLIEIEQNPPTNQQQMSTIIHLRTSLHQHLGHLLEGGHPDPNPAYKAHPVYKSVVERFASQQQRLGNLEKTFLRCRFGFKDASGDIVEPTIEWSVSDLQRWNAASEGGRCWLIDNPSQHI